MEQIKSVEHLDSLKGSITLYMRVEASEDGRRQVIIYSPELEVFNEIRLDISGLTPEQLNSTCDIGVACLAHLGILATNKFWNRALMPRIEAPQYEEWGTEARM